YDVLGNEVALLKNELQKPGDYQTIFNAENLASGIYILNISAREFFSSRKMILLR
ncbi:MAG: peptidase S8, partial [Ignavibacteria bacterium]|nr:peptidase S8 [Ignavibacteria bacterium]